MTDDEMSDIVGGYESDILKSLSKSEKSLEWVETVTNPKYERNYQV